MYNKQYSSTRPAKVTVKYMYMEQCPLNGGSAVENPKRDDHKS